MMGMVLLFPVASTVQVTWNTMELRSSLSLSRAEVRCRDFSYRLKLGWPEGKTSSRLMSCPTSPRMGSSLGLVL